MSHANSPSPFARRLTLTVLLPLLICAGIVRGQDAIRPSLAGEAAAEARRQSIDKIPYNLQVGPIKFRFSATMGLEYNDNINLAEDSTFVFPGNVRIRTEPQEDLIFRPQINLNALWPITQLNTLRFDVGIGEIEVARDVHVLAPLVLGDPVHVETNLHQPEKATVGIWFDARLVDPHAVPVAGDDAVAVGWFDLTAPPPLAFPTDVTLLQKLARS